MKCENCGQPVDGNVCSNCGQPVVAEHTGRFQLDHASDTDDIAVELAALKPTEAALVVLRGPQAGEVWTLEGPTVRIGRAAESDLFLDDITVSRHHAVLQLAGTDWTVEDLGSLNGTYVDRQPIEAPAKLVTGAELQIGKFRFRFHGGTDK